MYSLLNEKDWSPIEQDVMQSSFTVDSLAYCISTVVVMESQYVSLLPPPTISFKDNWMKELGSEVAGGSEDSQQTQPKPKTNYQERGDPG